MSKGRRRGRKEAKMSAIKRHTIKPLAAAIRYARWPLASWASLALLPGAALAGPQGEQVAAGIVNVTRPNAQTTRVQQGSEKAIVNWHSFSVGGQEYVQFVQPGSTAAILNRVVGGQESQILGQISANGRVFLVNPQGVYFGPGAKVDAAGLTASTLDIGDQDFMAGRYVFAKQAGAGDAEVRNAGEIRADQYAVLIGDRVANEGVVEARLGTVALAAGGKVSLQLDNTGLVNFAVDEKTLAAQAGVENAGQLLADGGRVLMTAKVASDLVATAVNNAGVVRATGIDEDDGGAIVLRGVGGDVVNSGIVDASGANGGRVALVSDRDVTVTAGARVTATGEGAGKGGVVRLIADQNLTVQTGAEVRAAGGADGGQGGFVEVSAIKGALRVDFAAVDPGQGGALLIDPATLTIAVGSTGPVNSSSGSSGSSTTTTTVGAGYIEGKLNNGVDVLLVATDEINAGPGVTSITATGAGDLSIWNGTISGFASYGFFSGSVGSLPTFTPSTGGNIRLSGVDIHIAGAFSAQAGSLDGELEIGDVTAHGIQLYGGLDTGGQIDAGELSAVNGAVALGADAISAEQVQGTSVDVSGAPAGLGGAASQVNFGKLGQVDAVVATAGEVALFADAVNVIGNIKSTSIGRAQISLQTDTAAGGAGMDVTITSGGLMANGGFDANIFIGGFNQRADAVNIAGDVTASGVVSVEGIATDIEIFGHDLSLGGNVYATMTGSLGVSSGSPAPGAFITLQGGYLGTGGISVTGNVKAEVDAVHGLLAGVDIETVDARTSGTAIDVGGFVKALGGGQANGYSGPGTPIRVEGKVRLASLASSTSPIGTVMVGDVVTASGHAGATVDLRAADVVNTGGLSATVLNSLGTAMVDVTAQNTATLGNLTAGGGAIGKVQVQGTTGSTPVPLTGAMQLGTVLAFGAASADVLLKAQSATTSGLTATGPGARVQVSTNNAISITGNVAANGGIQGAMVDLGQSSEGTGVLNVTGGVSATGAGSQVDLKLTGGGSGITVGGALLANNTAGNATIEVTASDGTVSIASNVRASGLGSGHDARLSIISITGSSGAFLPGAVLIGGDIKVEAGNAAATSYGGGSSAEAIIRADRVRVGTGVLAQVLSPNVGNRAKVILDAAGAELTTGQKAIEVAAGGIRALNGSSARIYLDSDGDSANPLPGGISVTGDVTAAAQSGVQDNAEVSLSADNGPIRIDGNLAATAGSDASINIYISPAISTSRGSITVTGATSVIGQSDASLDISAYNGGAVSLGNVTVTSVTGSADAHIYARADQFSNGGALTINGSVAVLGGGSSGSLTLDGNTINVTGNLSATGNGSEGAASIDIEAYKGITIGGNVIARQLGGSSASVYIRNYDAGAINITGRVEADGGSDASVDIAGPRVNVNGGVKVIAREGGRAELTVEGMTGVRLGNVEVQADNNFAAVSILNGYESSYGSSALVLGSGDIVLTGGLSAKSGLSANIEVRNEFGALTVAGNVLAERQANALQSTGFSQILLQGLSTTLNGRVTATSAVGTAAVNLFASEGGFLPVNGGSLTLNGAVLASAAAGLTGIGLYGGGITVNAALTANGVTTPSRIVVGLDAGSLQTGAKGLLTADNLYVQAIGASTAVDIATAVGDVYLSNVLADPESAPPAPTTRKTINLSLDNSAYDRVGRFHTNTEVTFDTAGNPTVKGIAFNDARFKSDKTLIFDTQLVANRMAVNVANGAARFDQPLLIGQGALPASFGDSVSLKRLAEAAAGAGTSTNLPLPQFNGAPTFGPNAFFAARTGLSFNGGITFNDPDVPYVTFLTDANLDLGPGVFSINPLKQDFLAQFTSYTPGKTVHIENTLPSKLDGLGPYFVNDLHFKKLPGTTLLFGGALGPQGGTAAPGTGPIVIGANGALNVGGQNAFFVSNGPVTGLGNLVSTGFVADGAPPVPPVPPVPPTTTTPDATSGTVAGSIEGGAGDGFADEQVDERDKEKDKDEENVDVAAADEGDTDGVVDQKSNTGQMCE